MVSPTDVVLVLDIESDCGTFVTDVDVKPLVPVGVEVVVYVTRFGQTSLAKEHVDIWICDIFVVDVEECRVSIWEVVGLDHMDFQLTVKKHPLTTTDFLLLTSSQVLWLIIVRLLDL